MEFATVIRIGRSTRPQDDMRVFAAHAERSYAHVHALVHAQGRAPVKERQRGVIAQDARRQVQAEFVRQPLFEQGERERAASFAEHVEACVIIP